jgi:hypothetical protein
VVSRIPNSQSIIAKFLEIQKLYPITSDSMKCNLESLIYLIHEKKDLIRGNFHSMAMGNLNKSKETMQTTTTVLKVVP